MSWNAIVEILKKYLEQYKIDLKNVKEISFRTKNSFLLKKNEKSELFIHVFKIHIRWTADLR